MKKVFTTKNLVLMAMFSALAAVLMLWEFPIPFIAPNFYEIDLSEIPICWRFRKLLCRSMFGSTRKYNLPETQNKKECLHWNASWNVVHGCSRCCS